MRDRLWSSLQHLPIVIKALLVGSAERETKNILPTVVFVFLVSVSCQKYMWEFSAWPPVSKANQPTNQYLPPCNMTRWAGSRSATQYERLEIKSVISSSFSPRQACVYPAEVRPGRPALLPNEIWLDITIWLAVCSHFLLWGPGSYNICL